MGHLSKVMRRGYVHSKCVHHFELFTRPHEHRIPGGPQCGGVQGDWEWAWGQQVAHTTEKIRCWQALGTMLPFWSKLCFLCEKKPMKSWEAQSYHTFSCATSLYLPTIYAEDGEGNGNPLHYSCLENSMDRGAWWLKSMGSQRVRHDWVTNTFAENDDIESQEKIGQRILPLPLILSYLSISQRLCHRRNISEEEK